MPDVTITIGGRNFDVACQEGEEHFLQSAAQLLDNEASVLTEQIGRLPESRMLLMAGLMLADKTAGLEEEIRVLQLRAKALEADESFGADLRARLAKAAPADAAAELAVLQAALAPGAKADAKAAPKAPQPAKPDLTRYDITSGLTLRHWPDRIELSGDQVDEALLRDLKDWLERR